MRHTDNLITNKNFHTICTGQQGVIFIQCLPPNQIPDNN